jgi:aldose 1-epimerase
MVVEVVAAVGGAIAGMHWRDIKVLREAPAGAIDSANVRLMASYPLVPYSNRIGNARFDFRGKQYTLRANFPNEPHAIHGVGWQRAWKVLEQSSRRLRLGLTHAKDQDWPFTFDVEQRFELTGDSLTLTLRATNLDDAPMPIGLGFHPFFPINAETTLQTEWRGMWEMGEDKLPTRLVGTPESADFSSPRSVSDWKVDHCFVGWSRKAILRYPTHVTTLSASAACSNVVCFAPRDGRNFIALEPVSNVNNAFTMAANGVADTGLRELGRGDSFEVSMRIAVTRA